MVLWSGLGKNGPATAADWARANGGVTLEMTPGGNWLNDMKLYGESSPFTSEQADLIWGTVSSKFVSSANGQVRAVLGNVRPTSIYKTVELPSVLNNTSVTGLDALQLKAMSPLDFVNY